MYAARLIFISCLSVFGGLHVAMNAPALLINALSIANQDLERYFRSVNLSQNIITSSLSEERVILDTYTYAFINYSYLDGTEMRIVSLDEDQARYGEGKILDVMGKLVHISNITNIYDDKACSPNIAGTGGRPTPASGTPWIALVRRGDCTFEVKVRNVYEKGAVGVIIFNDKPDVMSLEKMQIKGKNRDITAVITYLSVGNQMIAALEQGFDVTAIIKHGSSGSRPVNTLNRTSVLFVSVSFIILMLISLVWLIFYYIQRFRYLQTKDQQSRQLCSVTKKAIMKIPTRTGKSTDEKDCDADCCAICIEAYKSTDCIRVLPCKHEFHKSCIDPWLIEHRTCPMCKLDVLKFYGYVFLGSEESFIDIDSERNRNALPAINNANNTGNEASNNNAIHRDLLNSREFILDFPRIFVTQMPHDLSNGEPEFPLRLTERSQSTISLSYAKEYVQQITNKLDEQYCGLKRFKRGLHERDDMAENLLPAPLDTNLLKRRRSRSAEGRFSGRRGGNVAVNVDDGQGPSTSRAGEGRHNMLENLTDASYALSKQRQTERFQFTGVRKNPEIHN